MINNYNYEEKECMSLDVVLDCAVDCADGLQRRTG